MTETEAKTKWCPMVRMKPSGLVADPRHLPDTLCLGSACMMWRFILEKSIKVKVVGDQSIFDPDTTPGYCGLAGKP